MSTFARYNSLATLLTATAIAIFPLALGCAAANANTLAEQRESSSSDRQEVPRLSVRGAAELEKPADQLELNIGVVTQHRDPDQAMSQNSRQMRAVVDAIERVGLGEGDYHTGRFQIRPVWSQRPPRERVEPDWRPEIVAYNVTNTIHVKTKKLRLAGEIIQAANKAGANAIDSIRFTLADPRVHRAEAIAVATANARSDARALAEAAGVRLVRVLEISLDDAQPLRPPTYERTMAMEADAGAPPITPGDVTVRANVNLVYQIAPQ